VKGTITDKGLLAIERAGRIQPQGCPFQPHDDDQFPGYGATLCGDWCPHFGEPEREVDLSMTSYRELDGTRVWANNRTDGPYTGRTILRLCHGTVLTFDEFTDERSGK
jgi:hypothetical protein